MRNLFAFLAELKRRRVFRGTTMETKTAIDRRAFIKTTAAGAAGKTESLTSE